MRRTKDVMGAALLGIVVAGCADAVAPQGEWAPRSPFVVSAPHVSPTSAISVAYVAMPPGSIRDARLISIRGRSGEVTTAESHGDGMDPIAVPAVAGDTLRISVTTTSSPSATSYVEVVPSTRPPSVIRTFPPAWASDVWLAAQISVVFSAPIAAASLSPTSLRLMKGGTLMPTRIAFADSAGLWVRLIPDDALLEGTEYSLAITQDIRDVDGQSLAEPVTVSFTTLTTPWRAAGLFPVTGTVTDESGAPVAGARLMSTSVSGPRETQLSFTSDADGKFSVDVPSFAGSMSGPSDTWDAIALLSTTAAGYDLDYRYVLASRISDLRIRLHRSRQIVAGDSAEITIAPDDAVCTNNVQDMHPWPTEFVCRTIYVLPSADGVLTFTAGACAPSCLPIGLEAEPTDWSTYFFSISPATGRLAMPVKAGLPVRVQLEIPWGSASQTFMLRTTLTPAS